MEIETLERLWRANDHDPDRNAEACLLEVVRKAIERHRHGWTLLFLCIGTVLTTITLIFGYTLVRRHGFDPRHEWASVLMLTAPWMALVLLKHAHDQHLHRFPDPGASIQENLRVRLDENRLKQQSAVIMFWLMGLFPIVIAIALSQLVETDKMTATQALQGTLLFGSVLGVSTVVQVLRYLLFLKPEGLRLARLLAEYEI